MKFSVLFFIAFVLLSCNNEPDAGQMIRELEKEDTLATQFNPAHLESVTDTSQSSCESVHSEMGAGEECRLLNTTIHNEYQNLIRENYIDGFSYLPSFLPEESKAIEINKEGLISAEFNWKEQRKLIITLSYDGGVTDIHLSQKGSTVLRAIYYSAD